MKDITEILGTYFRAWNEDGRTSEMLELSCAPEIRYTDPRSTCRSAVELAARIERSRAEWPSARVDFTSAVDGYDGAFRYTWVFEVPEAKLRVPGWDVIVRGTDGRIATLTSFFGALEGSEPGAALRLQPKWGG
jgi:hypothetical protein